MHLGGTTGARDGFICRSPSAKLCVDTGPSFAVCFTAAAGVGIAGVVAFQRRLRREEDAVGILGEGVALCFVDGCCV